MCGKRQATYKGISAPSIWTLLDARPWADLDEHIGSSRYPQQIKAWLSACQAGHEIFLSHGFNHGTYFPRRVIDVDEAEEGIVYLRERAEVKTCYLREEHRAGEYPAYWTLSHRW